MWFLLQELQIETKQVFSHVNIVFGQKFTRNAKNGFECLKLSEVEILPILTPNLYGFDSGLEAGPI